LKSIMSEDAFGFVGVLVRFVVSKLVLSVVLGTALGTLIISMEKIRYSTSRTYFSFLCLF
jgi:hypothetical protein